MDSTQRLNKFLELGRTAKTCGAYEVANDIFAVILMEIKQTGRNDVYIETYCQDVAEWRASWASDPDRCGYYDLPFVLIEDTELCIPLPLLSSEAISFIASISGLSLVCRKIYDRRCYNPSSDRSKVADRDIRRHLNAYVPTGVLEEARRWGLAAYQPEAK